MSSWDEPLAADRAHLVGTGRRYSTCKTQLHYLRAFARSHPDPWAVSSRQVSGWLRTVTEFSRRNAALSLRLFYAWAVRRGELAVSPAPAAKQRRPVLSVGGEFTGAWQEPMAEFGLFLRASGLSSGTARTYRHWLAVLAKLYPADPFAVTSADLLRWMGSQEWAPETRKSVRSAVRTFYGWALMAGRIMMSPADRLPAVRIPRVAPKPTPEQTLAAALRSADDKTRLMLLLGAYGGLRAAEIARVRFSDVVDGVSYFTGNGRHRRIVPLHPLLLDALAEEQDRRRDGGHGTEYRYESKMTAEDQLFPGTRGDSITAAVVSRVLSRVLGSHYTAHALRHRFASRAYAGQRDLRAVQELLGHSKPETTARYTAVPDGAIRLAVMGL